MTVSKKIKRFATNTLAIMGLWSIVIMLISSITLLSSIQEGISPSIVDVLVFELICISPWILFTPAIIWLIRNFRFDREILVKSIFFHLFAAAVVFSFHSVVQSYAVSLYYDVTFSWSYIRHDFLGFMDMRVMLYAGMLLAVNIVDFQKKSRETSINESRLKAELNEAKFHALLNQIQPDFLLKSLDLVNESLDHSEEISEEILTDFSDLLRIMLANVKRDEVTIKEDLKSFRLYLSILEKRMEQPLGVETKVSEECYEVLIPSFMMLIPVLEKIIDSLDHKQGHISKISYQAECNDGKTYLDLVIRGQHIPYQDVPEIIQKVGFHKIVEKFEHKYGKDIQFKTQTKADMIRTTFVFPFINSGEEAAFSDISKETILMD